MSKDPQNLADQLKGLNLGQLKNANMPRAAQPSKQPADFRPKAKPPVVEDMEAQMAAKLNASSGVVAAEDPDSARFIQSIWGDVWQPDDLFGEGDELEQSASQEPVITFHISDVDKGSGLTSAAEKRLRQTGPSEPAISPPKPVTQVRPAPKKTEKWKSTPSKIPTAREADAPTAKQVFERITQLVGASVPKIEPRPRVVKAADVEKIDQYVESGSRWLRDNPDPDFDDGYMVGFDFGTSALKLVVREPYKAGNEVAALPVPEQLRSQNHPYLWQTVIWFDPESEQFSLYPIKGAIALEGFKTGIIGQRGTGPVCSDPLISRAEAAAAFIALHLCHLFGWIKAEKPLERSTANNFLGVNFGVPVATLDDPKSLQPFSEVVLGAIELARSCEPLTLKNVKDALECVRNEDLPSGFALVPELSAALAGYAMDDTRPMGAHILMDVGASTLDMVAFNLIEDDGENKIKAFSASVELLGAAAFEVAKSADVKEPDFGQACGYQFHDTYTYACRDDIAPMQFSRTKNPRRSDVQLVVTGGGCSTTVHSAMIQRLVASGLLGSRDFDKPEPPTTIAEIECDRSRLLLAYGLAHDVGTFPHPTLPSRIPKLKVTKKDGPSTIGPEQM